MRNNSLIDDVKKKVLKKEINKLASAIGGQNYFLKLIEELRTEKIHPLMSKRAYFKYSNGRVEWNKVIYQDKVKLLLDILRNSTFGQNIMLEEGQKRYKSVLNLLKTLKPIRFRVIPKNIKNGAGFTIMPLEIIDSKTTTINFMFLVIFILPVHIVKKYLIARK
jgi:hypothetical protein